MEQLEYDVASDFAVCIDIMILGNDIAKPPAPASLLVTLRVCWLLDLMLSSYESIDLSASSLYFLPSDGRLTSSDCCLT